MIGGLIFSHFSYALQSVSRCERYKHSVLKTDNPRSLKIKNRVFPVLTCPFGQGPLATNCSRTGPRTTCPSAAPTNPVISSDVMEKARESAPRHCFWPAPLSSPGNSSHHQVWPSSSSTSLSLLRIQECSPLIQVHEFEQGPNLLQFKLLTSMIP